MTRYIKLLMLALFAAIAVALPSCSDDDDSPDSYPSKIVGSWKRTIDMGDGWIIDQYVQFQSNGKYVLVDVDRYHYKVDEATASWSIDGDKITLKPDYDTGGLIDSATYNITELTDTKLTLSVFGSLNLTFERVADSEVEKAINSFPAPNLSEDSILGSWKYVDESSEVVYAHYYQFKPGGECTTITVHDDGYVSISSCSWSIDGENLILRYGSGFYSTTIECPVKEVTSQKIVLFYNGVIRQDLIRVSDAEVEKYLRDN